MEAAPLVNKVQASGLLTIDLEKDFPKKVIASFDIKDYLFHGLILKEKDFREALKQYDWAQHRDHVLCIYCSTDAIIPVWAYMLVTSCCAMHEVESYSGTQEAFISYHYTTLIDKIDVSEYENKKIVIKGCSDKPVPHSAYAAITAKLQSSVSSIMYGEPCSTVPIYKSKK